MAGAVAHPAPPADDPAHEIRRRIHQEELLRRYAIDRSPAVREQLVNAFMPLARSLALRYRGGSEPHDDLIQVASLGLVKAIDGFDLDRGRPFAAYAVPTILGELRRHFRDNVWNLRLPRGLQELTMKINRATDELTEGLGRTPTATEVAEALGVGTEQILEGLEADRSHRTLSLNVPVSDEPEGPTAVEMISRIEAGYDRVEAQASAATADLDEGEWRMLRLRFVDDLTQTEIGSRVGVSQMQVSRISRRALWKLLTAVRGADPEHVATPPRIAA